jgi:Lon protease-like protein
MSQGRMRLPLFALNTVLFPGGLLPLKVFEQRYVEMVKTCLRDQSPFGVCMIREGAEVGNPAVPAAVGCTAHIDQWDLPHPNLFHLVTRGGEPFRVLTTEVDPLGLIVCEAEAITRVPSDEAPDALCREVLATVVEKVGAEHFPAPIALDDADWVSYRLAEVLPLAIAVRQMLLEMPSAQERLAVLRELLVKAGVGSKG